MSDCRSDIVSTFHTMTPAAETANSAAATTPSRISPIAPVADGAEHRAAGQHRRRGRSAGPAAG